MKVPPLSVGIITWKCLFDCSFQIDINLWPYPTFPGLPVQVCTRGSNQYNSKGDWRLQGSDVGAICICEQFQGGRRCVCEWHSTIILQKLKSFTSSFKQCAGPSWYLATDMQLFIITPLILLPMWWFRKYMVDYLWPCLCIVGSIILLATMTAVKGWPATAAVE